VSVVVAVPLFHPDDESSLPTFLQGLAASATSIVVIDNGGGGRVVDRLMAVLPSGLLHVVANVRNVGQAEALNQAITHASLEGAAWVLVLDQDSEPTPELIATQVDAANRAGGASRVAVAGATSLRRDGPDLKGLSARARSRLWSAEASAPNVFESTAVTLSSGSLVSVGIAFLLGGFDERLFIDEVDNEYCLRARIAGYRVITVTKPTLRHSIGSTVYRHVPLIGTVSSADHPPVRQYYMARNLSLVTRWYWRTDARWLVLAWRRQLGRMLRIVVFLPDKRLKLAASFKGFRDGLGRRTWKPGSQNTVLRPGSM
jgi:rhamnosyltransferase